MTDIYTKNEQEVFKLTNSCSNGLSAQERKNRIEKYGENTLGQAKKTNYFLKYLAQFKDIMVVILLVAAVVSLVFAIRSGTKSEMVDALVIFGIVIVNAALGFVQEVRAENALENLEKMSQPFSTILQDGKEVRVKTQELVLGDVVVLNAGDVVPADLYMIECKSFRCDESALTGESHAVEKTANIPVAKSAPLAERSNMCYSGSTAVYGRGKGVVVASGKDTEMGKIASYLTKQKKGLTPLQKSLNKLGEIITFIVLAIAIIIFSVDVIFAHHGYIDSFLTAVAIAVAAIPESMPAVVTIILSIGVTRLTKKNAIIKKLHAVETLGCCQVICSDKTGTITQNKMNVVKTFCLDNSANDLMLSCMSLCNDAKLTDNGYSGDPTEVAILEYAKKNSLKKMLSISKRIDEIPFDSTRKMMSTLNEVGGERIQFTKGGVDEVLSKCEFYLQNGQVVPLDSNIKKKILFNNSLMATGALRVLAFATKEVVSSTDFCEKGMVFLGLCGMIDPPREEVFDAIKKCKKAGIKTIMITGDHMDTARAIAKKLGMIKSDSEVISGKELDKYSDRELKQAIHKYRVFARVSPEHKVRIVKAFKDNGKIVAMTGDGVNDAPSIKCADIGIGMGKSGTEVAKSVSDMVLTDDNFATIVLAVEEGRNIFHNIQKTIQFLLSCNIAEVLTIFLITMLFPQNIFLNAVQILFINLVTDTFPSIALGIDGVNKEIMQAPPRDSKEYIIGGKTGFNIIYQGLAQTILSVLTYLIGIYVYSSSLVATTMSFYVINMLQLFHIYNVRSSSSIFSSSPFDNKLLNMSFVLEMAFLFAIGLIAPFRALLCLADLTAGQWIVTLLLSASILPICEIVKAIQNKKNKKI